MNEASNYLFQYLEQLDSIFRFFQTSYTEGTACSSLTRVLFE